jgi:uncharacterized membrane protein YesL
MAIFSGPSARTAIGLAEAFVRLYTDFKKEFAMSKNMGSVDRALRVIIALGIAVLIITKTLTGTLAIILGILAIVFLLTSLVGFCPLYVPFKLSTTKKT